MVTPAVQWTEPPGPVAVPVYITVACGTTDTVPAPTGVIAPTVSIEKLVAFVVNQDRVEESPVCSVAGLAESVQVGASGVGGGGGGLTVMSAWHVTTPPAPVAVRTYVVFAPGETLLE